MSQIKKFIDKVSMAEARQQREVMLSVNDAKELRDEVMKLFLDQKDSKKEEEVITVVVNGGKW